MNIHDNNMLGVIFDLDGTLVSSELDFSLIKAQVGCPLEKDLLAFIAALPSPYMREEAMNIVHQHELLDAQHSHLLPGVASAVTALKENNIPDNNSPTLKVSNNTTSKRPNIDNLIKRIVVERRREKRKNFILFVVILLCLSVPIILSL